MSNSRAASISGIKTPLDNNALDIIAVLSKESLKITIISQKCRINSNISSKVILKILSIKKEHILSSNFGMIRNLTPIVWVPTIYTTIKTFKSLHLWRLNTKCRIMKKLRSNSFKKTRIQSWSLIMILRINWVWRNRNNRNPIKSCTICMKNLMNEWAILMIFSPYFFLIN